MSRNVSRLTRVAVLLAGFACAPPWASAAFAQASGMGGVGATDTITARATVESVDAATRAITMVGAAGNKFTVIAGPQVINFEKIKAGDTVFARYTESVAYVLTPAGVKAPKSSVTTGAVAAPKGNMPSGAVGGKLVVSGLVVGIDAGSHTLQLVNPSGGGVVTAHVRSKEGLRNFRQIKVGDTITAVVSQALAVAIEPAS